MSAEDTYHVVFGKFVSLDYQDALLNLVVGAEGEGLHSNQAKKPSSLLILFNAILIYFGFSSNPMKFRFSFRETNAVVPAPMNGSRIIGGWIIESLQSQVAS